MGTRGVIVADLSISEARRVREVRGEQRLC